MNNSDENSTFLDIILKVLRIILINCTHFGIYFELLFQVFRKLDFPSIYPSKPQKATNIYIYIKKIESQRFQPF